MIETSRFTRLRPIMLQQSPEPESLLQPLQVDQSNGQTVDQSDSQTVVQSVIQMPEVMAFLFQPARYKVAYGGRGGVKSWSFARALLLMGAQRPLRILCAREFQNSIRDSVHRLLQDQIPLMHLSDHYQVFNTEIKGITGTEFFFAGLKNNVTRIKSMEGIDICWVEEAEKVSENSWQVLIPTIRTEGSEIWISFNPHQETDPTYKRFITNPPPAINAVDGRRYCVVVETGWKDNPWLPEELEIEKDYLARVDKDAYDHVWGGQVQRKSNSQVMHGKCALDNFAPELGVCDCGHRIEKHSQAESCAVEGCKCRNFVSAWKGPYFGADWGFSSDPATLIKEWVYQTRLYIEYEFWGIGIELEDQKGKNDLPTRFSEIPGAKENIIRADDSRPETISYMKTHGYPKIVAAKKGPGSVEDGVSFLRSFEKIIIHPRCVHTDEESRTYKHKVDALTGDVLPEIVDKNNHCWDAIRYGLEPLIKKRVTPGIFFVGKGAGKVEQKREEDGFSAAPSPADLLGTLGLVDTRALAWFKGD